VYETRVQTMYGKVAPHEGGSMEALTLGGDETKSVTLTLPKVATPQAFDVRVALENTDTTSNAVIAHYVLVGSSATIRKRHPRQGIIQCGRHRQGILHLDTCCRRIS
jgi:hypothetical protein